MFDNITKISEKLKSKFYYDFDIGKLTWFRTGGKAKIFIIVENSEELEIILNEIKNLKYYILGAGSNLLVRDKGYSGIIIKLGKGFNTIKKIEDKIKIGASNYDNQLAIYAMNNNLKGFEFFSGIPGTIGGAIKMNAGCYGLETKKNLHSIEDYDSLRNKKILKSENLDLEYRSSNIKHNQIISSALFNFEYGNKKDIQRDIQKIKMKRSATQPISDKTSGSTFKNPSNNFAAELIEKSECKGLQFGDASISLKHANFIINNGNAKASDIENLGKLVIDKVLKKFGIILDWEIKIIGDKN